MISCPIIIFFPEIVTSLLMLRTYIRELKVRASSHEQFFFDKFGSLEKKCRCELKHMYSAQSKYVSATNKYEFFAAVWDVKPKHAVFHQDNMSV